MDCCSICLDSNFYHSLSRCLSLTLYGRYEMVSPCSVCFSFFCFLCVFFFLSPCSGPFDVLSAGEEDEDEEDEDGSDAVRSDVSTVPEGGENGHPIVFFFLQYFRKLTFKPCLIRGRFSWPGAFAQTPYLCPSSSLPAATQNFMFWPTLKMSILSRRETKGLHFHSFW